MNKRREILFLEATLHYDNEVFVDFTKFSDYFLKISKESANVIRRPKITAFTISHYRNVRGLGKSMVVFRLFEKLRYSNERSTIF